MRRIVLMLLLTGAFMYASTLSNLMARYKRAPESQRYRIMNQIKLEIARLNKKRQRLAIRQLRSVTKSVARKDAKRKRRKHQRDTRDRPSPLDIIDGGTKRTIRTHTTTVTKTVKDVRDTVKNVTNTVPVPHTDSVPVVEKIPEKIPDMIPKMPKGF